MARSFLAQVQRQLYIGSRAAGDIRAAQRGPDVLAKRLIRRELTRRGFGLFGNGRRSR